MNILMIGNTASISYNLKQGLEKVGHDVTIISSENNLCTGKFKYNLTNGIFQLSLLDKKLTKKHFDILHIHAPNTKIYLIGKFLAPDAKVILHFHGTSIRKPRKLFSFFIKSIIQKADYVLYSTIDLRWYLRFTKQKELFRCPVDTDLFKPISNIKKEKSIIFNNSGKRNRKHEDMPLYMNGFISATIYPNCDLSPYLVSVTALECASCGLKVKYHSYMNRKWVLKNASIKSQTHKLLNIYNNCFKNGR